ncbi:hypothetical protein H6P81_017779 [Aristolochia fimbriata]|uniref:Uncharacterized protein n=1 Tax=Aristolochia fimbriata TaxID=158543 RepID=A0AAV7E138_ARIFI|nr:hypothetical protein H6P81_017779 [Aristolochia fimbriata]
MSRHRRWKLRHKNVASSPLEVVQQKMSRRRRWKLRNKNVALLPGSDVTKMSSCLRRRKSCDNDRRTIARKLLTKKPSDEDVAPSLLGMIAEDERCDLQRGSTESLRRVQWSCGGIVTRRLTRSRKPSHDEIPPAPELEGAIAIDAAAESQKKKSRSRKERS